MWKKIRNISPAKQKEPVVRYIKLVNALRPQTVSLMNPSGEEPSPHIQVLSDDVIKKVDIYFNLITIL